MLRAALVLLAIAGLISGPGWAQDTVPPDDDTQFEVSDLFQSGAAELDDALEAAAEQNRFSSAIAVFSSADGRVWAGTYGRVDGSESMAPTRNNTRYLIASITKTMTAVCVLQLYDRGLIDSLDDPANAYLTRVQLDGFDGQDVTIRHLLTHTSGLRTLGFGIIRREQQTAPVSAAFVRQHTPGVIREPGEAVVYSNVGFALLGTLVEDITGDTLQDYMARELFAPLGMDTATLNYEVAPAIDYAKPSLVGPESSTPLPFDANTPFLAPAGSVMATVDDMAAYMSFVSDAGETWSADILSADVFSQAFSIQAQNNPKSNAVGLGFFLTDWNGTKLIGHTGAFSGFTSYFSVSPETGLSAFIATAGQPAPGSDAGLFSAYGDGAQIINRLISAKPAQAFDPKPIVNAGDYTGFYVNDRRFTRGVGRLVGLQSPMMVSAGADGLLQVGWTSGVGEIAEGVVGTAGDGATPSTRYGLPSAESPYFTMNADRARKAKWLELPSTLYLFLIGGVALTLIGSIGGFAPVSPTSTGNRMLALTPVLGLLALGGIFAALLLFYSPGQSILSHLISGETLRVRLINLFAWLILFACLATAIRLYLSRLRQDAGLKWLWVTLRAIALVGLLGLSVFVVITGLADPRLV